MKAPTDSKAGGHSSGAATRESVARWNTVLDGALTLAQLGIPPIRCKANTKKDTIRHGNGYPTTDPAEVRRIFTGGPWNLGAKLPRGMAGVDIDVPKGSDDEPLPGAEAHADRIAANLEAEHPELHDMWKLRTRSGGLLYVGMLPEDETLPSTVRALDWVDLRGDGRTYVLVPPSTYQGREYTWIRPPKGTPATYSSGLLTRFRAASPPTSNGEAVGPVGLIAPGEDRTVDGDPERYARGILDGVRTRLGGQAKGGRHQATLDEARAVGRWVQGYTDAGLPGLTLDQARDVLEHATDANGYRGEDPRTCDNTIRDGLRYGVATPYRVTVKRRHGNHHNQAAHPRPKPDGDGGGAQDRHPADPDVALLELPHDDLGYAHATAHQHYPMLRKHAGLGFLAYAEDEHRHVTGEAAIARAHELAVLTQRSIMATAQRIDDEGKRKDWERYARSLRSKSKRDAALELMLRTRAVARDAEIDGHDLEVNTPDGVVDLRTLEMHPHDPRRIFTAVTRGRYRPDAQHSAWDAVLELLHQDGRAEYVQRALGQTITGRTNREMFVFEGPKATGKTTLGEGLLTALGTDYAASVDPGTLLEAGRTRSPGGPRSDLVALRSARLALTSEPNGRARLDGQTVKRMTGSDSITARAVHGRTPVTFRPTFTIVMLANEVPAADWTDDALLSRLKLVPFRARPARIDPRVRAALADDPEQDALDALFTWAVLGAHLWIADGFSMGDEPEVVTNATRTYRVENDPFALWAEDRLRFEQADAVTTVSDLHADYSTWAGRNGITEPQRVEALGKWLKAQAEAGRDIERKRTKAGSSWRGVRIVGPTG